MSLVEQTAPIADAPEQAAAVPDTVVLLHGLGLGNWAMWRVAWALARDGYRIVNLGYPSLTRPIEELAQEWLPKRLAAHGLPAANADRGPGALHFVTHSMGGIVLRGWLKAHGVPAQLKRVVMFAPPNQGTPLVDRRKHWWLFHLMTGVNGRRLGTGPDSFPIQLGPWPRGPELGIIAGDCPALPFLTNWASGPCDGKVPVACTRLEGQHDHIVLRHSHTWIEYRRAAIDQVRAFLRNGCFAASNCDPATVAGSGAMR